MYFHSGYSGGGGGGRSSIDSGDGGSNGSDGERGALGDGGIGSGLTIDTIPLNNFVIRYDLLVQSDPSGCDSAQR